MVDALQLYEDHRRQPRNLGRMADADAIGNVGSVVVGRALRLFLKIEDGRIATARFQTFSCSEQVAPTSALTELLPGRSPAEAATLGATEICTHLGDLPWAELPPALWGVEALRDAVAKWHGGDEIPVDRQSTDLVCRCYGVDRAALEAAWRAGATSVDALAKVTGAGTGCGSCRVDLERLLAEWEEQPAPAPAAARPAGGRIALLRRIEESATSLLADARRRGLDCNLWDLQGVTVLLKSDDGEEAQRAGLAERLQRTLQDDVDPTLRVEFV